MSSELKFVKCLEWCTKLPGLGCQVQSPVFLLKGSECLFRFALQRRDDIFNYYILYVQLKKLDLKWKPCDVHVQIGFKTEMELSVDQATFTLTKREIKGVWSMDMIDLQSQMRSDYCMKFRFCFKDVNEIFMIDRKNMEDKCHQTGYHPNPDSGVQSLIEDMSKLLDTGENHDAEINCGEHCIKVHKHILCARSEVFKAMLGSNMVEGRTGIVEIKDMDINHIQDFVKYLYTGKMPELTFEKAKVLYEAGDKYAVRNLMLQCSEYLQANLSPENAFECLVLSVAHSDEKLKNSFIALSLSEKLYLQEELWIPVCENYPKIGFEVGRLSHTNNQL